MEDLIHGKIMIIGTEAREYKVLEHCLQEEYILSKTIDSQEVLDQVRNFKPDLIILDCTLMETDDKEVFKRLHEMIETKEIPVILLTRSEDSERIDDLQNSDVCDYITEPFNVPVVRKRIRNYIELKMLRDWQRNINMPDDLTQIENRQRLIEALRQEWERAKRNGTVISVAILDIDAFKKYNDAYGHKQGDQCLHTIAQMIKGTLNRPSDTVARWGSKKFACILPETDLRGTLMIGENIRKAVYELKIPHVLTNTETSVTVSIGTASIRPTQNGTYEDVIRIAEKALDMAKKAGGNKVEAEIDNR